MNLDKFQKQAVTAKDRNILVVAAPGSGKTTVIVNRIKFLVENMSIEEGRIVVLTFTKAAATNMKNRYIKTFNKNKSPFFGTFHGLFYKMLLREGYKIDIIEGYVTNKIIENTLKKYFDDVNEDKIKEVLNNISLYSTSNIDIEEFEPSISKEIFIKCYESYTLYKKQNNLWDFDDLAIKVIELLKNDTRFREGYRRVFSYMLVDEFQDCDELQIEFLKIINEGRENSLFAVGDEDQCIYSFRGSCPEYMVIFNNIFSGGKKYYLSKNYRSSKNIIESAKLLIENNKKRNSKEIYAHKQNDGDIKYSIVYDERQEGDSIVKLIRNKLTEGYRYKDNIVLYRTNMESMGMVDVFIRNNIPFTMIDKEYNFFNHFICRDLIDYLRLTLNPYDKKAFVNIINKPFRYVSRDNLNYIREYIEERDPLDILIEKEDVPPFQKKKLAELKIDFAYIRKASLGTAIQYIIMDLGYIDYLKSYSEKFSSSFDDLEEILEGFKESAAPFKTILEFFNHIEEVKKKLEESKKNSSEDRVLLSTIHGVKGMEFKNVYIINCNEDTIPHYSSKKDNLEEERRLFYVGITRAIDNLYLYSPKSRKGTFKEPSRFIEEAGFTAKSDSLHGLKKGMEIYHRNFGNGSVYQVNGDEVTLEFENGSKKKFSGKVLIDKGLIITIAGE